MGKRKENQMHRVLMATAVAWGLSSGAAGQAQRPIQWASNAQQGVSQAKRVGLPVLFYVTGSGREGGDLKDAQQQVFRDDLVRGIAEARFVPIRLSQSSDNRAMLERMGVRVGYGFCLVVATPELELVGTIPPGQLTEARALARQLTAMFRKYRTDYFERELKPKLEEETTQPGDVIKVLKAIEKLLIIEADDQVAKLLDREELSAAVKKQVYNTLAVLSAPAGVKALLKAAPRDKLAANALNRCTAGAAGEMLPALESENFEEFLVAYEAVTKICNIKGKKPRGFWGGKNERLISEELERVKEAVTKSAKRWREQYEAYR
jgi:hypothetical protein